MTAPAWRSADIIPLRTPHAAQRRTPTPPALQPSSSLDVVFEHELLQHRRLFAELQLMRPALVLAALRLAGVIQQRGRLLLCGNGAAGLACQHLAALFNSRLRPDWAPPLALALPAEPHKALARRIAAEGRPRDGLVVLSSTGESGNLLLALQAARDAELATVALLGRGGGRARELADVSVVVPHDDAARIQEAHIFVGHLWCSQIEHVLQP